MSRFDGTELDPVISAPEYNGLRFTLGGQQIISGIVTATAFNGSAIMMASNNASGTMTDARFPGCFLQYLTLL